MSGRSGIRALRCVIAVLAALAVTGACQAPATPGHPEVVSPFEACPVPSGTSTGSDEPDGGARMVPAVALPCFTDGEPITIAELGRPAVINFWASSCAPCRKELAELQRFADNAGGRVVMLGVNTRDTRTAAAAAGEGFGVRFPSVYDPEGMLLQQWGRSVLPVTLFVDAQGRVRHEDLSGALTLERVSALAEQYLGVVA
jgi:thiol-disulfide isomerase/thioredoxin